MCPMVWPVGLVQYVVRVDHQEVILLPLLSLIQLQQHIVLKIK